MKQKQLANVLIKILGLSTCVQAIVRMFTALSFSIMENRTMGAANFWSNFASGFLLAVIGICLVVKSAKLAAWLFRDVDE